LVGVVKVKDLLFFLCIVWVVEVFELGLVIWVVLDVEFVDVVAVFV